LPVATAYAVWTGIGATGTAAAGMIWLGESRNAKRFASLLLVVAGSVGMKFFS
jgi:quaternary ammonium compound-resistance protein SugE